jgi:ribosomal-protein-alanine N-acetyltransferase
MVLPDDFRFQVPRLETARLVLRQIVPDDADDVFAYASDSEVAAWTTWEAHQTLDDSREFIGRVQRWYADGFGGPWGLELKETGRLIGTCGMAITPHHSRAELGYALGRRWWGHGLMTEAVLEALRYGFNDVGLNRIEARCIPANIGSARVMEKAGMTYEGTLREQFYAKGSFVDLKMYSILWHEWAHSAS